MLGRQNKKCTRDYHLADIVKEITIIMVQLYHTGRIVIVNHTKLKLFYNNHEDA